MDGRSVHSILLHASSLVFTTNGAYHPWKSFLSMDCRVHQWNPTPACDELAIHTRAVAVPLIRESLRRLELVTMPSS